MIEATFDAINFYFAFTAVLIHAVFIVVVLTRTTRAAVHRTFLFMCVSWIVWNFGIFMTHFYGEGFWFYVALTGSPMMPALLYHFIHGLCRPRARSAWVLVGYTLSALLSVGSFLAIVHSGIKTFVDSVAWNVYFLGALFPFIVAGVALLVRTMRDAGPGEERDRLRYILWATVIGTLMGFTDLIQIFNVPVPKLGHLGSVIYSSVFAVGMFRHRASYDLIAQMRDRLDLLSEMAAGIAHEVRGPLGSIKGASRLLAAEVGGTIKVPATWTRIVRSCVALVLGTVLALGAAVPAWPAPPPGPVEGTWRSHRTAGGGFELILTLVLLPNGTAELYTATVSGEGLGFLEEGTWRRQDALITVLVFEPGRPPSPNELILEQRGDTIVPVRWNAEFYGRSPPGPFLRQPEGIQAP